MDAIVPPCRILSLFVCCFSMGRVNWTRPGVAEVMVSPPSRRGSRPLDSRKELQTCAEGVSNRVRGGERGTHTDRAHEFEGFRSGHGCGCGVDAIEGSECNAQSDRDIDVTADSRARMYCVYSTCFLAYACTILP
jgi:hypothetical protein